MREAGKKVREGVSEGGREWEGDIHLTIPTVSPIQSC